MKLKIKLEENCKEVQVTILASYNSPEVKEIVSKLSGSAMDYIFGFREEQGEILQLSRLKRFYCENKKVFAELGSKKYLVKSRLYKLEERLDSQQFVRISQSEIINLQQVKSFDLNYFGTIGVQFLDGSTTFVARRYVSKIKENLQL